MGDISGQQIGQILGAIGGGVAGIPGGPAGIIEGGATGSSLGGSLGGAIDPQTGLPIPNAAPQVTFWAKIATKPITLTITAFDIVCEE